jgi:hypothetical protein
LLGPQVLEC